MSRLQVQHPCFSCSLLCPFLTQKSATLGAARYAVRSLRELKRLDSTSRSPVYAAYTASLSGLISVRAFGQSEARQRQFEKLLDANARAWFWWLLGNRWIGFRLDMLSTSIVMFSMIFGVALRSQMSPGVLGVALV